MTSETVLDLDAIHRRCNATYYPVYMGLRDIRALLAEVERLHAEVERLHAEVVALSEWFADSQRQTAEARRDVVGAGQLVEAKGEIERLLHRLVASGEGRR